MKILHDKLDVRIHVIQARNLLSTDDCEFQNQLLPDATDDRKFLCPSKKYAEVKEQSYLPSSCGSQLGDKPSQ